MLGIFISAWPISTGRMPNCWLDWQRVTHGLKDRKRLVRPFISILLWFQEVKVEQPSTAYIFRLHVRCQNWFIYCVWGISGQTHTMDLLVLRLNMLSRWCEGSLSHALALSQYFAERAAFFLSCLLSTPNASPVSCPLVLTFWTCYCSHSNSVYHQHFIAVPVLLFVSRCWIKAGWNKSAEGERSGSGPSSQCPARHTRRPVSRPDRPDTGKERGPDCCAGEGP